jgi:hypothetical protein
MHLLALRIHVLTVEDMAMQNPPFRTSPNKPFDIELDDLLHPASAFSHPREVVNDPDLTLNEKRAILASWASDACAVEAAPTLRKPPGNSLPIPVDDILEALCSLDKIVFEQAFDPSWSRRQARRLAIEQFRSRRSRGNGHSGRGLPH